MQKLREVSTRCLSVLITMTLICAPAHQVLGQPPAQTEALCGSRNVAESIVACTRTIDLGGQDKDALSIARYNRGNAHAMQGRFNSAIDDYTAAIDLHPAFPGAYNNRGNARAALGAHAQAVEDYSQTLRLAPEHGSARINRAASYMRLQQFEDAIKDLSTVIDQQPNSSGLFYQRGLAYEQINELARAEQDFRKVLSINPSHVPAQAALVRLLTPKD